MKVSRERQDVLEIQVIEGPGVLLENKEQKVTEDCLARMENPEIRVNVVLKVSQVLRELQGRMVNQE